MAYDRILCPNCSVTFGQEAKFKDHLVDQHGIDNIEQHYIEKMLNGVKPLCGCGCGGDINFNSWKRGYTSKYVRGHNASVDSIYLNPERQKQFTQKRLEGYASGRTNVWNKGLTKENDARVANTAAKISESMGNLYKSGYSSWQTGLTKNSDVRVATAATSRNKALESGVISVWNKGLTKQTDDRVLKLANERSAKLTINNPVRLKPNELADRISKQETFVLVSNVSDYKNKYTKLEFNCKTCNKTSLKNLMMLKATPICFNCHPYESKGQLEIYDFVKSLAPDAILSDRSVIAPKELDVYVPSAKFGIEYDGLYWHSELHVPNDHAEKKNAACDLANVKLLRIYEDEWRDKRPIIESMIKHRLGIAEHKYHARKLVVIELTKDERKKFFDVNHLEGDARSERAFGLVSPGNRDILAAISIRRPFHKSLSTYSELSRCCTKLNTSISGWLGKLSKHAHGVIQKPMMTYVDSRVGSGMGYYAAGWKIKRESTSHRFWWTDFNNRFNRFKYKADKTRGMSQQQIADEAGVFMLLGSSNSSWTYCG